MDLNYAVVVALWPNKGQPRNTGIRAGGAFRQLHLDFSGHLCPASVLCQEKENGIFSKLKLPAVES